MCFSYDEMRERANRLEERQHDLLIVVNRLRVWCDAFPEDKKAAKAFEKALQKKWNVDKELDTVLTWLIVNGKAL
jgi:hypothetical protein